VLLQSTSVRPTTSAPGRYTVDRELFLARGVGGLKTYASAGAQGAQRAQQRLARAPAVPQSAIIFLIRYLCKYCKQLNSALGSVPVNACLLPHCTAFEHRRSFYWHTACLCKMPDDNTSGLLKYDLDVGAGRTLKIISDPCHTQHPYCCGNGLWTACVELIAVLAGADPGCSAKRMRSQRKACGP